MGNSINISIGGLGGGLNSFLSPASGLLGGSNLGSPSLLGGPSFGSGGNSIFGNSSNGIANQPGIRETLFKLSYDAQHGDLQGVMEDIASLGYQMSNLAGQNASGIQPLPPQFGGGSGGAGGSGAPSFGGGAPSGSPASSGGGDPASSSGCGGGGGDENRLTDLQKQLMQMFGPLLQMFAQVLQMMMQMLGNSGALTSSLNQSRFGALQA